MDSPLPDEPIRLTADDPLAGLTKWLAAGRVDAAAAERARRRWLERQAAEDATIAGVLLDLAERERPVAVRTVGGRTVRGRLVAMGADFVAVREERRGDVLVPRAAIATVRPGAGDPPVVGDRPAAFEVVLAEALVELAADRPSVLVVAAGEELRGELRGAGRDVASITLGTHARDVVHVAIAAIDHLVVVAR